MGPAETGFDLISWQGWGVTGSIVALLILFTTILLWLLPFPQMTVRGQLAKADDRTDLRSRFARGAPFSRYRTAIRRFDQWLTQWFGQPWSAQSFERCVAIAFVFPVALFLLATVLHGYKHGKINTTELMLFIAAVAVVAWAVGWLFRIIYLYLQRAWRKFGGDSELAEIIARILLGAFAVVFAFAIAFAVASSVAGQFSDAGTVVLAILGGFAFAIAFTIAYVIAGIWALAIALVIVTILALTIAKQFAFFLLLFFIILPILNALMDWISWAVTRFLLTWLHEAPDGLSGITVVIGVLLVNVVLALMFVVALAILLPIGLEMVELMLSIFGHDTFNWRTVAAQAVQDPWNEGLFVTGMLLTPLVPSIANMTLGLAALTAPFSPGAYKADQLIPEHPEATPSEAETGPIKWMVFWSRLWYLPSVLVALAIYACTWTILYALDMPMAKFLHTLALCSTSWGQGTCPGF
ncbi:MAG: hypothetical protein P8Y36_03575 [Alphaproteobacteria bacterium]